MREAFGPKWGWILFWAVFFSIASAGVAIPVAIGGLAIWAWLTSREKKRQAALGAKNSEPESAAH